MNVRDCNGTKLAAGDSVTPIEDFKVKRSNVTLKHGALIKGIRFPADEAEIEGKSGKVKGWCSRPSS
jgi:protein PhnA